MALFQHPQTIEYHSLIHALNPDEMPLAEQHESQDTFNPGYTATSPLGRLSDGYCTRLLTTTPTVQTVIASSITATPDTGARWRFARITIFSDGSGGILQLSPAIAASQYVLANGPDTTIGQALEAILDDYITWAGQAITEDDVVRPMDTKSITLGSIRGMPVEIVVGPRPLDDSVLEPVRWDPFDWVALKNTNADLDMAIDMACATQLADVYASLQPVPANSMLSVSDPEAGTGGPLTDDPEILLTDLEEQTLEAYGSLLSVQRSTSAMLHYFFNARRGERYPNEVSFVSQLVQFLMGIQGLHRLDEPVAAFEGGDIVLLSKGV